MHWCICVAVDGEGSIGLVLLALRCHSCCIMWLPLLLLVGSLWQRGGAATSAVQCCCWPPAHCKYATSSASLLLVAKQHMLLLGMLADIMAAGMDACHTSPAVAHPAVTAAGGDREGGTCG